MSSRQLPYPNHEQCAAVIAELSAHNEVNPKDLTDWEKRFIASNKNRRWFTESQKETVRTLGGKYVLKAYP